ncbi:peptidase [Chitinispirillum alkaliphilum]|nr:peptidase [Chitinispirillum alkaliphilum]
MKCAIVSFSLLLGVFVNSHAGSSPIPLLVGHEISLNTEEALELYCESARGIRYSFAVSKGESYVIDMKSDEVDSYLELSVSGMHLSDDDGGEGYDARIIFEAESDDNAVILARTYEQSGIGAFSLGLSKLASPIPLQVGHEISLSTEEALELYCELARGIRYSFAVSQGERYIIDMKSDEVDSYLELSVSGMHLSDDDGGEGHDARLFFEAQSDDNAVILARTYNYSGIGAFSLGISKLASPIPLQVGHEISLNTEEALELYCESARGIRYSFAVSQGESYIIDMKSDEVDSYLELSVSGMHLSDDDGGEGHDARIIFEAQSDDNAVILARTYNYSGIGAFSLGISKLASPIPFQVGHEISLSTEEALELYCESVRGIRYSFAVSQGESYIIDMKSDEVDSYLELDVSGMHLSDDDGGEGYDARIIFEAESDDSAVILARTHDHNSIGAFSLSIVSLSQRSPSPVTVGETVSVSTAQAQSLYCHASGGFPYSFEIKEGEKYIVEMMSDEIDSYLEIAFPDGKTLVDDDGGDGRNARVVFTSHMDGEVDVLARTYSRSEIGPYNLRVSQPEILRQYRGRLNERSKRELIANRFYTRHTYRGTSGKEVLVILESDCYDTYLVVSDRDGNLLELNDDFGGTTNSRVTVTIPDDRRLVITNTHALDQPVDGEYKITIYGN